MSVVMMETWPSFFTAPSQSKHAGLAWRLWSYQFSDKHSKNAHWHTSTKRQTSAKMWAWFKELVLSPQQRYWKWARLADFKIFRSVVIRTNLGAILSSGFCLWICTTMRDQWKFDIMSCKSILCNISFWYHEPICRLNTCRLMGT